MILQKSSHEISKTFELLSSRRFSIDTRYVHLRLSSVSPRVLYLILQCTTNFIIGRLFRSRIATNRLHLTLIPSKLLGAKMGCICLLHTIRLREIRTLAPSILRIDFLFLSNERIRRRCESCVEKADRADAESLPATVEKRSSEQGTSQTYTSLRHPLRT